MTTTTKESVTPELKSSPINPVWAEEVSAHFGLAGPIAKYVGNEVNATISKEITRKYSHAKLAKIVRNALSKHIK